MFTALGLLLAGVLKAELTLALANAIYLVLAAIGGLALAPDGAGSGAVQVAVATPSGALALLMGEALPRPGDDVGLALLAGGVVLAWLTAGVALAARWFRWEP
jgi:ABC-2 type transport system permease protein